MTETLDIKGVLRTLDEFGGTLAAENDTPRGEVATKGVGDDTRGLPVTNKALTADDRFYMQRQFMKLSEPELGEAFMRQLQKKDTGVPADRWLAGNFAAGQAIAGNPILSRALDLAGGQALIRQDLEPILYSLFVKAFPAYDRFAKEPSNGQVHTWNQITSYGDAQFMSELGTVTDDKGTYDRKTTNISVLATRRGVSIKNQLSILAGGMNWDAERLELQLGITAMAHKVQKTIFQGQATNSGGQATDELGAYDANAFDGLRSTLNSAVNASAAATVNFAPYLSSSPDSFVTKISVVAGEIVDNGSMPNIVYMRVAEGNQLAQQQTQFQRFVDRTEVIPGLTVPTIATNAAGLLPIVSVPGDSIGHYTSTADSSRDVADVYVLNDQTISMPYLGSPSPTILDIPPGVAGQLTHLFIAFWMGGLAVKALPFVGKLRAEQRTS